MSRRNIDIDINNNFAGSVRQFVGLCYCYHKFYINPEHKIGYNVEKIYPYYKRGNMYWVELNKSLGYWFSNNRGFDNTFKYYFKEENEYLKFIRLEKLNKINAGEESKYQNR